MSGFEALKGAEIAQLAGDQIFQDEVVFDGVWDDLTALKVVTQDADLALKFIASKSRPTEWDQIDNLYRAAVRVRTWPGTDKPRSALSVPVILEAVEKLMPVVHLSFFSDKQPFLLTPLGKTTPEAARAKEKLLVWAIKESGFKEEIRKTLKSWLLYGFCAAKWGWKTSKRTKSSYQHDTTSPEGRPRVKKVDESYEISHPTIEQMDLRNILFDPSLREQDCRKGKWVCAQIYINADKLDDLRTNEDYKNVPTRDELAMILANNNEPADDSFRSSKPSTYRDLQAAQETQDSSVDPLSKPLEILEYVTDECIVTVLQRKIVIRNQPNEFGKINFLSAAFIDVPGSMYGFGVAKLIAGEQGFQVGVLNSWVDQLAIQLNPSFQLKKGIGAGTQQIAVAPGKVVNENGELIPLPIQSVSAEALGAIQNSEVRATRRVGANGADYMPTQALRTAEGVNSFTQDIVNKLQYLVEIFADLVFVPALEAFLEVCKTHLQPEDINRILSETDAKAYQGDILEVYNGSCSIEVLSSTKLAARKAAGQLVPLLLQTAGAQPMQDALTSAGKKFNYEELLSEAVDLAGWDCNSLIVDASPDEIQRSMMMKPGAQKAQADASKVQEQTQGQIAVVQAKAEADGLAKAGVLALKHVFDQSAADAQNPVPKGE